MALAEIFKRGIQKVLLDGETLAPGEEKRLLPSMKVHREDRLHFHISNGIRAAKGLKVRILFGTPVDGKVLLADSTVWFEEGVSEREFSYETPQNYGSTGFVMSVPVVAPLLYDIILTNTGTTDLEEVYVTVMSQEI